MIERTMSCQVCGLNYIYPIDRKLHDSYCKRYVKACVKFDTIFHHYDREVMKQDAYNTLYSEGSSVPEKVAAVEKLFRAYFSRSVDGSGLNLKHPSFPTYCAMLLNQKHWVERLEPFPGVYKFLLKRYGQKAGINEGKTYAKCDN